MNEETSGKAWWVAEQARMQAEQAHLKAAAAEEEHRMWDLRHNFEDHHSYGYVGEENQGKARNFGWSRSPSSPRDHPSNGSRTEDLKEELQIKAHELRAIADELKEKYHQLLDVAKSAHEEARAAGKRHDEDCNRRHLGQDQLVEQLGRSIQSPPMRWNDMYLDPIRKTWRELPPLAGTEHYILSDRWMQGLNDDSATTSSLPVSRNKHYYEDKSDDSESTRFF